MLTPQSDTCFSYEAPANYSGIDTVTITVTNEFGIVSTADVYFFVQFNPPIANNDSLVIPIDGIDTVNVLANDTDIDNNINPTSVTVVSGPSTVGATVNVLANGQVIVDFSGSGGVYWKRYRLL